MAGNPFDQSYDWFNQAGQMAQDSVSPQSRDRAAARLRASMEIERNRRSQTIANEDAGKGRTTAGVASKRQDNLFNDYYNALGKGMGEMENAWTQNSINAANAMGNAGQGLASAANAQMGQKNTAIQNYIQGGNVFADPTGPGAQGMWGQVGLDITGLDFFGGPGTVNPISVSGGGSTNVNVGTGTGTTGVAGNDSLGSAGLASDADIPTQAEVILKNYKPGTPVVMNKAFVSTPLGNYIYNRLIALTGNRVRISEPDRYRSNAPFYTDSLGTAGSVGGG